MNKSELKAALEQQRPRITSLYGQEQEERQIARYGQLIDDYERAFGNTDCALFSAPGRTEVGGNHTDHQHGRVLAASVNTVSYTHLRAHETGRNLVCRLLLEKKKKLKQK